MKEEYGYCDSLSSRHTWHKLCVNWRVEDTEPLAEWEKELLHSTKPKAVCNRLHAVDLPDPEIKITFGDGTYYKVGCSAGEAALIMVQVANTLGIRPSIYNEDGERLGTNTDNQV